MPLIRPMVWAEHAEVVRASAKYREHKLAKGSYAIFGLLSELGELADLMKRQLRVGHEVSEADREKVLSEVGDILWYVQAYDQDCGVCSNIDTVYTHPLTREDVFVLANPIPGRRIEECVKKELIFLDYFAREMASCIWVYNRGEAHHDFACAYNYPILHLLSCFLTVYFGGATLEEAVKLNMTKIRARMDRGTLHNKEARIGDA